MIIQELTDEHIRILSDEFGGAPFTLPETRPLVVGNASSYAFVGDDGLTVFGALGVTDLFPGVGELWAAYRKSWKRSSPITIARETKRILDRLWGDGSDYHRLELSVYVEEHWGDRWAKMLGFKYEGVLRKRTEDKRDIKIYSRT